jgi:hypothetical protein
MEIGAVQGDGTREADARHLFPFHLIGKSKARPTLPLIEWETSTH